jgi:hypothetical protein
MELHDKQQQQQHPSAAAVNSTLPPPRQQQQVRVAAAAASSQHWQQQQQQFPVLLSFEKVPDLRHQVKGLLAALQAAAAPPQQRLAAVCVYCQLDSSSRAGAWQLMEVACAEKDIQQLRGVLKVRTGEHTRRGGGASSGSWVR